MEEIRVLNRAEPEHFNYDLSAAGIPIQGSRFKSYGGPRDIFLVLEDMGVHPFLDIGSQQVEEK